MEPSERALLGGSTFIIGLEDEQQEDIYEMSSLNYIMLSIIESIGKDDFKNVYWCEINNIKSQDIPTQRIFCERVLTKVFEIYEFLPENVFLDSNTDMNNVYSFIEFLEFDSLDFITGIWKFFDIDLRKINIDEFCKLRSNEIIREFEEQINFYVLSRMTTDFLRTYNKDSLINWFIKMSRKMKFDILLNIERRKK